ncbi:MAG: regulatory protein RecX [Microbacteriaceae bacterium]|nr:regulatory protein RecX [Microbacteriaceae bacterium]
MVVRFLPAAEAASSDTVRERGDLAEVIEFRSRLASTGSVVTATEPRRSEGVWGAAPTVESAAHDDADDADDSAQQSPTSVAPLIQLKTRGAVASASATRGDITQDTAGTLSDDLTEIEHEPVAAAHADAVKLLARRARSSGELRRELAAIGHHAVDIEEVVLECETSLYLDDLGLARVLTETLRERKRASRSQIQRKLRERLLPDWAIDEALAELDEDTEHALLREAAHDRARKMRGLDRQVAERRLLGFLARRGWSGERAIRVAREALDNSAARGTVTFR